MIRRTASIVAALTGAAFLLAAAPVLAVQDAPNKKLKIVSSLPQTGSANAQTTSIVNGIKMAIEERSAMVDGFKIEFEAMDDASPQKGNWDGQIESANAKLNDARARLKICVVELKELDETVLRLKALPPPIPMLPLEALAAISNSLALTLDSAIGGKV